MAGDVGCAQHLAADVAGDLPFMSDHVGAQSVFGGEGRSTSLGEDRVRRSGQRHTTIHRATQLCAPARCQVQPGWNMSNFKGL